jgi:hypothetical protein
MPACKHFSRSPASAWAVMAMMGVRNVQFIPDHLRGAVTIHHRHLDIHQDQVVLFSFKNSTAFLPFLAIMISKPLMPRMMEVSFWFIRLSSTTSIFFRAKNRQTVFSLMGAIDKCYRVLIRFMVRDHKADTPCLSPSLLSHGLIVAALQFYQLSRVMASPSPVPPYFRVICVSACVKRSKMVSILSAAMPMPVSRTR